MQGDKAINTQSKPPKKKPIRAASGRSDHQRLLTLERELRAVQQELSALKSGPMAAHIPTTVDELRPRRLPPPGLTAMEAIAGKWPGDEPVALLLEQLKTL